MDTKGRLKVEFQTAFM